jgi:pyruvate/2-oxoglutarate dehydrogenase complex dihydrolipoamide dehydrogenase (E3) component
MLNQSITEACTGLCYSEIASVGLTEKQAKKRIRIKIGKFRSQLQKSKASGTPDGL